MLTTDMVEKLASAQAALECAIRSLLEMNSPAAECPLALQRAADLLSGVHLSRDAFAVRGRLEPVLQSIAVKAAAARRLLDSAAGLHFGAVLYRGPLEQGYGANGIADKFCGGGLRVDG